MYSKWICYLRKFNPVFNWNMVYQNTLSSVINRFSKFLMFYFIYIFFLELEKTAAKMLGKEDGLYVSSGTMGNLISSK